MLSDTNGDSTEVVAVDNHIYIYSEIDTAVALEVNKKLRELDAELVSQTLKMGLITPIPIVLHINSFGGDVFSSFSIVDRIEQLHSPVYSVIEGACASGATIIAMGCGERFMTRNSYMLIHQLTHSFWGTYEQHTDNKDFLDSVMERIISFYKKNSDMSKKEIRKILRRDRWFDAAEALTKGMVDKIL